jgi:hypothetical protein
MKELMKKILCVTFTICLCGLMLIFNITGCTDTEATTEDSKTSFVIVEQELIKGYYYKIAYHKDTKVMYVLGQYNDFTIMLDADGKPLLWEGK